jgi:hypothetical protein
MDLSFEMRPAKIRGRISSRGGQFPLAQIEPSGRVLEPKISGGQTRPTKEVFVGKGYFLRLK